MVPFLALGVLTVPLSLEARYTVSCRSVIFSDSTRVKRLYGKRVHERVLPASTTKVMTALMVLEKLSLDDWVTVSHPATLPQPTKLHMKAGDRYRVRDLMYAILLNSANDGAVVLAEAVSGSHANFVRDMNRRAREIGARNTRFANANGLPSKEAQYTTAYDMYLIFRRALRHEFFREAIKTKRHAIRSRDGREHALKSHNRIFSFDWKNKIYGKTGYTRAAGACFTGTIQKGNSTLIMAFFNCPRRWDDIKYVVSTYGNIPL
jgi:D-alanyl-D-alanine carboxypeptidase (penicillin-binding protein 5/6)